MIPFAYTPRIVRIEAGSIILSACIRCGQKYVPSLADTSLTETTGDEIWNRNQDTDDDDDDDDEPTITRSASGTKRKVVEMTCDDDGALPAPGSAHPPPFSLSEDSRQDLQVLRQDIHRFVGNIQAQNNPDTVSDSMIQSVCMSKDHLKRNHSVHGFRELKKKAEGWYSSNGNVELRLVNAANETSSEWKAFYERFNQYPAVKKDSGKRFKTMSGYHVCVCYHYSQIKINQDKYPLVEHYAFYLCINIRRCLNNAVKTAMDIELPHCFSICLSDTTCLKLSGKPCMRRASRALKHRFFDVM